MNQAANPNPPRRAVAPLAAALSAAICIAAALGGCATPREPVKEAPLPSAKELVTPVPPTRKFTPPAIAARPVNDNYHGTVVADPYRYFEDAQDPAVAAFMKAQADYARGYLDRIPARADLLKRITQLSDAAVSISRVQVANGRVFYFKLAAGDTARKIYMRESINAAEHLLVDPARLGAPERRIAIDWFRAAPNGRLLAYGTSPGGNEESVLRVLDVDKAADTGVAIPGARYGDAVAWAPDSRALFYNRLPASAGAPIGYVNSRVYRHVIGHDAADDTLLFGRGVGDDRGLEEIDIPRIVVPVASNTALAVVKHGDQRELAIWAAPASTLNGAATPWKQIVERSDEVVDFEAHGADLWLLSHKNALRGKLLRTSLMSPDLARAATVVPESDHVITGMAISGDALYIKMLNGGVDILQRLNFSTAVYASGKLEYIRLPFDLAVRELVGDPLKPGALLRLESWTEAPAYTTVEARSANLANSGLLPKAPVDFSAYDEVRLYATAKDGTRIPVSMVYRKGLLLSHDHPTLLTGYGAYGLVEAPYFQASRLAWLERGGIYATCHVRGGGEYGEPWHRAGQKATKGNTVTDFIACAEFLIQRGFTNPRRLAAMGGSAGGITVGNSLARRPDLFAAVVARVGALDMLRMETTPNGKPNVVEFGSTQTAEGFKALYDVSAYHQIKERPDYPGVLLTTGANDPRVEPWNSLKFAARLQQVSSGDKPVLLRVDYGSGHGAQISSSRSEELADIYAFLFWQFGMPDFQPR